MTTSFPHAFGGNQHGVDPRLRGDDIDVRLEGKAARGIGKKWVRQVVTKTLLLEKISRARVSVWVTGNRQIRTVNKKHLNHDYATDVIAFGAGAPLVGAPDKGRAPGPPLLGDLVISVEMARAVAKRLNIPFKEELARYLVHGALHLLGYDDRIIKERRRMHERQERILNVILR